MLEDTKVKLQPTSPDHHHHQKKPKLKRCSSEENQLKEESGEEEEVFFEIDYIVKQKFSHELGIWQYLVKWKGYSSEQNTWEPKENIVDTLQFDEFTHKTQNRRRNQKIKKEESESESSLSDLDSTEEEEEEAIKRRRTEKGKGPARVKSDDSSDDQLLFLKQTSVNKNELNQTTHRRQTRQSTSSQQKPPRLNQPKPKQDLKPIPIKESLRQSLQQHPQYDQTLDSLSNAHQAINWNENQRTESGLKGSSVVIWSARKGNQEESETRSLWFWIENEGGERVRYGRPNRNLTSKNSFSIKRGKAQAVKYLFIHRNLLGEIGRLEGLNELLRLPDYVPVFEFGNAPDGSSETEFTSIRPIMTMSSVLIPTYDCIMKNINTTTNPFQIFRALQRDNHYSQLFLHPLTLKSLCNQHQSSRSTHEEKTAISELFNDLETRWVSIHKESLMGSRFGVLKILLDDHQDEKNEIQEIEGIVQGLNQIRDILYRDIRRFVVIVDDTSSWLTCTRRENLNRIRSVEVMSISEATECFATSSALL